jgi:hypothetical protein
VLCAPDLATRVELLAELVDDQRLLLEAQLGGEGPPPVDP